jgi:ParB/RepB/Spo0J family partition protein
MREFRQLSIDTIHESAANPRRVFSEQSLEELAASIRRRGVLQPILVRPHDDGFTLIAGARRLRASKLAGCPTIPARVLELDEAGRTRRRSSKTSIARTFRRWRKGRAISAFSLRAARSMN